MNESNPGLPLARRYVKRSTLSYSSTNTNTEKMAKTKKKMAKTKKRQALVKARGLRTVKSHARCSRCSRSLLLLLLLLCCCCSCSCSCSCAAAAPARDRGCCSCS